MLSTFSIDTRGGPPIRRSGPRMTRNPENAALQVHRRLRTAMRGRAAQRGCRGSEHSRRTSMRGPHGAPVPIGCVSTPMYRGDISVLRFRPDKARVCHVGLRSGPPWRRWPRWRDAPSCSSSPSSACSTRARCTATSCASGSTPRSAPSGRCPTARSTLPARACSTRAWIAEVPRATGTGIVGSRRARIVYQLTADGKERFQELVDEAGPAPGRTTTFGVHFAFFARTDPEVRLRILEGRRSRLEERLDRSARPRPQPRAARRLHRGAAAARPGVGRARGPLADRADHRRARPTRAAGG